MVRKIMQWVPITVLLPAVTWRPSANYQILLHFMVCAGAVMVVLALFKYRIETYSAADNRSDARQQVTVRL
jgi:hypothetical protein